MNTPATKFIAALSRAVIEKNVEDAYKRLLGVKKIEYPFGSDGLMNDTLFEFKQDANFRGRKQAQVLAQLVCYLHEFSVKGVWRGQSFGIPLRVVGANRGWAFVVASDALRSYFEGNYDWDRAASSPDPALVDALETFPLYLLNLTTTEGVCSLVDLLTTVGTRILKVIDRRNFAEVFAVWKETFAKDHAYVPVLTDQEQMEPAAKRAQLIANKRAQWAANCFLLDVQETQEAGFFDRRSGKVIFVLPENKHVTLEVPVAAYLAFWSMYHRPATPLELSAIIERKDQLVAMQTRRVDGEYFTPVQYAAKAHEYLAKTIPDRYKGQGAHHSMYDDYNWYDPCCGTGNLTLACPSSMEGSLFLSTLNKEDIDTVRAAGQNPTATAFQCDFLNDVYEESLEQEMLDRMTPGSKWIFILNPPFSAGTAGRHSDAAKSQVSATVEGNKMRSRKLGHACQNLTTQFLHRLQALIQARQLDAVVATFSQPTFMMSDKYSDFLTSWRKSFGYRTGFCFHSREFQGAKGDWPVTFTIWGSGAAFAPCLLDVYVNNAKVGRKEFTAPEGLPLNKWAVRPKNTIPCAPLKGAMALYDSKDVRLDRIADRGFGYASCCSNNPRDSNFSFLLSSARGKGDGYSILAENFEPALISTAVRKITRATWLNDRDEFVVPDLTTIHGRQVSLDVIVWGLFSNFNETSSMANVEYNRVSYDIKNEFFWLTKAEMEALTDLPPVAWNQVQRAEERFVSQWLAGKEFSPDVARLLALGKELVTVSAGQRRNAQKRFQLDRWDAGWYQIRNGLYGADCTLTPEMLKVWTAFQVQYKTVTARLRQMVYTLGFLPAEVIFESVDEVLEIEPDLDEAA